VLFADVSTFLKKSPALQNASRDSLGSLFLFYNHNMLHPYTKDSDYSYTAGFYPTFNLVKEHKEALRFIYASEDAKDSEGLKKLASLIGSDRIIFSKNAFEKLAEKGNDHVIGVFSKYEEKLNPSLPHVVLVNPSDQGNLGNIMRSMLAFSFKDLAIILPSADPFNPKTVRASMGAFFSVRHQCFASFDDYQKAYPRPYYPFMLDGSKGLRETKKPEGAYALVFGNEATGLDKSFSNGQAIRIEQSAEVDSLNLATAVVVALYYFRGL
jgi:TrmH family RNA methyltransferase